MFEIPVTYNNVMKHSATELTPKEARKPSNELTVKLNLASKARRNRTYPELKKGDDVKMFKKKENQMKKKGLVAGVKIFTPLSE